MLFHVWWLFCTFFFGMVLVSILLSPIVHSQLYDCYNLYKLALKIKCFDNYVEEFIYDYVEELIYVYIGSLNVFESEFVS